MTSFLSKFSLQQVILSQNWQTKRPGAFFHRRHLSSSSVPTTHGQWCCPLPYSRLSWTWKSELLRLAPTELHQRDNPMPTMQRTLRRLKDILGFHSLCLVRQSVAGKAQPEPRSQVSQSTQSQTEVLSHRHVSHRLVPPSGTRWRRLSWNG